MTSITRLLPVDSSAHGLAGPVARVRSDHHRATKGFQSLHNVFNPVLLMQLPSHSLCVRLRHSCHSAHPQCPKRWVVSLFAPPSFTRCMEKPMAPRFEIDLLSRQSIRQFGVSTDANINFRELSPPSCINISLFGPLCILTCRPRCKSCLATALVQHHLLPGSSRPTFI